ncbi:hypothetical protein V6141_27375, partial [Klebsiella pneumoniae]|uniref:hypothetical protein n=1 Tax=Klebsiella pneumoniae TaxID=573 RepID=UPI001C8CC2BA
KRAYYLKTQPATGETYLKSDLFNKADDMMALSLNELSGNKHTGQTKVTIFTLRGQTASKT